LEAWGISLASTVNTWSGGDPLPSSETEAALDFDRTGETLFVRSRRPGDRFCPLGLGGTKKVQDYLVDSRVPRHRRDRVPLLLTQEGQVAWLIGHRIDDRFKIRPETRRVLRLKALPRERANTADAKIDIEKDRP
jgi:tRNA(Ile)-lysidine synthase